MSLGFMRPAQQARLDRFVELARVYRGWTRTQLASRLGRDPSHLVPSASNAKLGFLRRVADALDWEVRDVVDSLWEGRRVAAIRRASRARSGEAGPPSDVAGADAVPGVGVARAGDVEPSSASFAAGRGGHLAGATSSATVGRFALLDGEAMRAHRHGRVDDFLTIAREMTELARTPTERAIAALRECGAWDLRGRYVRALEVAQRGLSEEHVPFDVRVMLRANLAQVHHTLWHLVEAVAVATELIDFGGASERRTGEGGIPDVLGGSVEAASNRVLRVAVAFAHYVRGSSLARSIWHDGRNHAVAAAKRATADLQIARDRYEVLAAEFHDDQYAAIAHTCRGILVECEAASGQIDASDAVQGVMEHLGEAMDLSHLSGSDWIESYGWWAIAGCNIALRHLDGHELHRAMAVCTNKALEIADRLDHWALRERAFTMERFRRQRVEAATGFEPEWLLDEEDIRVLVGTMGRFPTFRRAGWAILDGARLFEESDAAEAVRRSPVHPAWPTSCSAALPPDGASPRQTAGPMGAVSAKSAAAAASLAPSRRAAPGKRSSSAQSEVASAPRGPPD